MKFYSKFLLFASLLIFFSCTKPKKCTQISEIKITSDIYKIRTDSQLVVVAGKSLISINGAKVGKIENGRFTDQTDEESYNPLMEALYDFFRRRGDEPYGSIIIYVYEKHSKSLVKLIQKTAMRTYLAPVIMIPFNFDVTDCNYVLPKNQSETKKIVRIPGALLIRQEKDRILVDGNTIITLVEGKIPVIEFDSGGLILDKLLKIIQEKNTGKITPILHITFDANMIVTRHILLTAGKAGIYKIRTFRVLP